jgi:hypothetical protein
MKKSLIIGCFLSLLTISCTDSYLDEVPLDRLSPENLLTNEAGYNSAIIGLYQAAREEYIIASNNFEYMNISTDMAEWGRNDSRGNKDYTLLNSSLSATIVYWDWAYKQMISRANLVLENIDDPGIQMTAASRANIKGQALFFRGYAYNFLVNIYGGVPIVDKRLTVPKFDFVRNSREEVLRFAASDLDAASKLLDLVVKDGKIPRAAAFHVLSEVYISLGMITKDASFYDKSIAAASSVINKEGGDYQLMTSRFGTNALKPGDVFSDIFAQGQINISKGNKEIIWAHQYESFTLGGATTTDNSGNNGPRYWAPAYADIRTPNNVACTAADTLNKGIGVNSLTNYVKYTIWELDPNDMRNSKYNIRRQFYYDAADPEYFGKPILFGRKADGKLYTKKLDGTLTNFVLDTLINFYPWIRKIDGAPFNNDVLSGRTSKDLPKIRIAETYLLRAEANFRKGNVASAAQDINIIRSRAKAKLITPSDVTEDFILDERARELITEEARLRTLIRMGRLVDRVRKYNSAPSVVNGPSAGKTIRDFNNLWPIPQKVIDANTGAMFEQNPGY